MKFNQVEKGAILKSVLVVIVIVVIVVEVFAKLLLI